MPKVDYAKHERLRRNARLELVAEVLYDIEARCAAMRQDDDIDAYEMAKELFMREWEAVEDAFESAISAMANDEGEPVLPWRIAIEEAREWALRRPFRGDLRPPLPLPNQQRLSFPEVSR